MVSMMMNKLFLPPLNSFLATPLVIWTEWWNNILWHRSLVEINFFTHNYQNNILIRNIKLKTFTSFWRCYSVAGLDPARPLVDRYGSAEFRLTRDDATMVQVIHTNAGFLGEAPQVGHVDFCVNGGRLQPSCAKEPRNIRNNYCSSPVWRNDPLAQLRCRVTIFLYYIHIIRNIRRLYTANLLPRLTTNGLKNDFYHLPADKINQIDHQSLQDIITCA